MKNLIHKISRHFEYKYPLPDVPETSQDQLFVPYFRHFPFSTVTMTGALFIAASVIAVVPSVVSWQLFQLFHPKATPEETKLLWQATGLLSILGLSMGLFLAYVARTIVRDCFQQWIIINESFVLHHHAGAEKLFFWKDITRHKNVSFGKLTELRLFSKTNAHMVIKMMYVKAQPKITKRKYTLGDTIYQYEDGSRQKRLHALKELPDLILKHRKTSRVP